MSIRQTTDLAAAKLSVPLFGLFAVVFLLAQVSCSTLPSSVGGKVKTARLYRWLVSQQDKETGLLGNQEGDDVSGVYANALAAMCYIHEGDLKRADRIFSHFDGQVAAEFDAPPGGFPQMWNPKTGEAYPETDRWIGDNAWLLMALNYYHDTIGANKYKHMSTEIENWLVGLQDDDGGILSGYNTNGLMMSKSTEGNLDCYVALKRHPEVQKRIGTWLEKKMWIPSQKRFMMGSTSTESALDGTSWGIAALGKKYASSLTYAEKRFWRRDRPRSRGEHIVGFADFSNKSRIWFEGTGQMVVAYRICGRPEEARRYLTEMDEAVLKSERFLGAVGLPCFTSQPEWEGATEKIFVPSQAWYLFGSWGFNPFAPDDTIQ